jgi:hypothetical protein
MELLVAGWSNLIRLAPRPSVFEAPPLKMVVNNDAADPSHEIDCDETPAAPCLSGHRLNQASPTHTCRGRNLHPFRMEVMGLLLGILAFVIDGQPPQLLRRCNGRPSKSV